MEATHLVALPLQQAAYGAGVLAELVCHDQRFLLVFRQLAESTGHFPVGNVDGIDDVPGVELAAVAHVQHAGVLNVDQPRHLVHGSRDTGPVALGERKCIKQNHQQADQQPLLAHKDEKIHSAPSYLCCCFAAAPCRGAAAVYTIVSNY